MNTIKFREKKSFHSLSLCLLRCQLVSKEERGTYLGQWNKMCVRDCRRPGHVGHGGVESSLVVSSGCVIGEGAGHATKRHYVIPRKVIEEVGCGLITDGWFERLLPSSYR